MYRVHLTNRGTILRLIVVLQSSTPTIMPTASVASAMSKSGPSMHSGTKPGAVHRKMEKYHSDSFRSSQDLSYYCKHDHQSAVDVPMGILEFLSFDMVLLRSGLIGDPDDSGVKTNLQRQSIGWSTCYAVGSWLPDVFLESSLPSSRTHGSWSEYVTVTPARCSAAVKK